MSNYIYVLKKNLIGETILRLKAEKIIFEPGDIVYIAGIDKKIYSRWKTVKRNEKVVILLKTPENSVSINFTEKLEGKYEKRINLLTEKDTDLLEKYFIHKITILPFYDIQGRNSTENIVLSELRKKDYWLEVYTEVLTNNINDETSRIYNFIIADTFGVMTFECIKENIFSNRECFEKFRKKLNSDDLINKLLLNSAILTDDGINLKIGYKKYYIVESEKDESYYNEVNKTLENNGFENVYVVNAKMFMNYIAEDIEKTAHKIVNKDEHFGILQMLMPQYINSKSVNVNMDKIKFMPDSSYEIDHNQKSILARMNERSYLKATAGSGKTILLLAKAYEVAVANPEKEFLIMCYNNKLAEDIRIQAENTGKIVKNLKINTFDKFIQEEVTKYNGENCSETFNIRREIFVENVRTGKYTKKFGGIFLDEMQQLEEEWIASLMECLDDNKYMILSGDYYQQIRLDNIFIEYEDEIVDDNQSDDFYIGKYKFKKIILDRNYRNTDEIVRVINKMLKRINTFIEELQVPMENEEKRIVIGNGIRKSLDKPKYFHVANEKEEIDTIIKCLGELINNRGYTPNEILLVSPWGKSTSHLIYLLKKRISKNNIEICDFGEAKLSKDGVRVGTIGKAIGLDFKAVIIYGTNMLQSSKGADKFRFDRFNELQKQSNSVKKEFIKFLKIVYVACSRARDTLIIIDDIKKFNLVSEFLKLVGDNEDG